MVRWLKARTKYIMEFVQSSRSWYFCISIVVLLDVAGVRCASIESDSYLSAYKLTHDLNDHSENHPTGERVVIVDANTDQHVDVHPVYVQHSHEAEAAFQAVNAEHALHADHLDVEHHYQPEYHEHYIDVKDPASGEGLGSYGSPPVSSYGPPAAGVSSYPMSNPVNTYGPPVPVSYPKKIHSGPVYGPPSPVYLPSPPAPVYGPPHHVYGPPHHKLPPLVAHEYYEPDPPSFIPDFLQNVVTPHAFLGLLDKIKWFKVDLFTIGQLILKLFIFKKFLTFFTILFLLMIIPALKHKGKESVGMMTDMVDKFGQEEEDDDDDDEEDDEGRAKGRKAKMLINKGWNALTTHVLTSIENFERKFASKQNHTAPLPSTINATDLHRLSYSGNATNCDRNNTSVYCKSQSVIEKIKTIMPSRDDDMKQTATTTTKPLTKHIVNLTSKSQLSPNQLKETENSRKRKTR